MTIKQIEQRLTELEKAVRELRNPPSKVANGRWWLHDAGRFANDAEFDEILRLGRKYRASQRPNGSKA